MAGKLIILYGINNLGKSTQAKLLVERLQKVKLAAAYLKYPLYDLEPSGPLINTYLREGNPEELSIREFQLLQVMNRTQYDAELRKRLSSDEWIVAEDYIGTGIAWGIGGGVDRGFLERLNAHLRAEDLCFLFQGERFMKAQEKNHQHETDHDLTERVRKAHDELAAEKRWEYIQANKSIEAISDDIWKIVSAKFKL